MKTKTGQFLMQQSKSKTPYQIPTSQSKPQQTRIVTPIKEKKSLFRQQSKEKIKNKQGQELVYNQPRYQQKYQLQILQLKDKNRVLCQQIDRLKIQCTQLKSTIEQKNHKTERNSLNQQKQNIDLTKTSLANRRPLQQTQQFQQQQLNVLQQKLRNLQVQNYRLIESNYVLLIRLKKNMKQYKDSLLRLGNMLENLQFSEASREIYGILGRMKGEEGWVDGEIGGLKGIKDEEKDRQKEMKEQYAKKLQQQKLKKLQKLRFISGICHQSHFPPSQSIMQLQNSIQLNLRNISTPNYHHPSNSFQLISQHPPKSTTQFPSKKLFNSQIHDPQIMQKSPSAKQFTDWENGQGNGSVIKRTVYKCHGNSTQLYKLLFLQASAIQSFFS